MKVSVAEAKSRLTQLIQSVERGERVTICRHGHPVADLVPAKPDERRSPLFGTLRGKVPPIEPRALEPMTSEEVDAFIAGRY